MNITNVRIRLPSQLHKELKLQARLNHRSLNKEMIWRLSLTLSNMEVQDLSKALNKVNTAIAELQEAQLKIRKIT